MTTLHPVSAVTAPLLTPAVGARRSPWRVLGAYVAMVTWVAGFKYTYASVAAILNQTNALFAMVLATVILKETFTRRKFVALALAFCGVILVTLSPVLTR